MDVEGLCVFVSFGSKMLSQRRAAAGDAMNCDAGALDGHRGRQLPAYGQEVERRSSFWLCVYWYIQSAKVYGDARRGASPQGQGGRGDGLLLKTAARCQAIQLVAESLFDAGCTHGRVVVSAQTQLQACDKMNNAHSRRALSELMHRCSLAR